MKKILIAALSFLIGCIAGCLWRGQRPHAAAEIKVDTVLVSAPAAADSAPVRKEIVKAALARRTKPEEAEPDTCAAIAKADSVEVELPIVSKEYAGEEYRAWVSGWQPRLDSIRIYQRVPAMPTAKPKRWHLGVTAGWAFTGRGMSPYVGIGITYSFISF